jgi:hypothetical protein
MSAVNNKRGNLLLSAIDREVIREVVRRWETWNYPAQVDMESVGIARDETVAHSTRLRAVRRSGAIWSAIVRDAGASCTAPVFAARLRAAMAEDAWAKKNPRWERKT